MSPSSNDTGRADPPDPGSEQRLLNRVRQGSSSAVGALFERYAPWLRRRASGRLPQWARSGVATSDLVQDVLHHAFARLNWFESKHVSALRAYLRRAVENRVQDGLRQAIRRLDIARLAPGEAPLRPFEDAAPTIRKRRRGRKNILDGDAELQTINATVLDRVHAAMLLQDSGLANALRTLLGAEQDRGSDFLRLANALSALYPRGSQEKRLLDAMLLAVPR